ncbi:penicillin-binding protein 2 [bacterium]|nr:penicillin-binding protein 2 [bacterium]NCQ55867.1 penicillin-binding protein 2 [Candidatus Parcubacteria bacterium]NCS67575.1 penicillin-binding protein 2 [Candidatus Peregrinibacteria bacterium]NCS96260.1 penicillin-binding protein 2 [bacterium]
MRTNFGARLKVVKITLVLVAVVFTGRLFSLQVINFETYAQEAKLQHEKRSVLPARRGKILVHKNYIDEELTPLATNNTLKMLFVDPLVLAYPKYNPQLPLNEQEQGDPNAVAALLAPVLIHAHCEEIEGCEINTDPESWTAPEKIAITAYEKELREILGQVERTRVVLDSDLAPNRITEIENLALRGISLEGTTLVANPTLILNAEMTAQALAPMINIEVDRLTSLLERRPRRYVEIVNKIVPEVSEKITEMKENPRYASLMRGIQMKDEYWRYYPERSLASQVLGFVDSNGNGQYGIEGRFDLDLRGQEGYIYGATNTRGQRILGKDSGITQARDGADIVISIDRVIQGQVEKILEEDTERFQADFGQVIIVEPNTGKILAMANSPSFDPNEYGKAFLKYEIPPEQYQLDLEDENFNQRIPTLNEDGRLFRYFNVWGPTVFRNKLVADLYEPGSVMKALTMAAAINAAEVTPTTLFQDTGPVEVDDFNIRNSDGVYAGPTSMISVLNRSLNTGIAFVTRKMGSKLVYEYMRDFGFGQYTDVELPGEADGGLEYWQDWSESELITRGFGQGIAVTPLQMVMGFASLANGGYLYKPIIVEEVRYQDGRPAKIFHPEVVRRVVGNEAYNTVKSMLLNVVTSGGGRAARVSGYSVMGKTGTSQTYRNGKVLEGVGTTIASFAGFGPIQEPKFVMLVKYDYPKTSQFGSETAAITFQRIAEFLFDYFEVPPDR